jgi:Carboxypeptidase regulatory-like domain/TonB-dependent Receptor Plug Domain
MKSLLRATAILTAFTAFSLFGQDISGSIVGTVQDASGAGIPGAKVTITNSDRNAVMRTATTESDGNFSVPVLPIGHYSLTVEGKGFKRSTKKDIELNVNDRLTVNFNLEVGDVQQEVTVEANTPQIDLQSSAAQGLITGSQIRELGLNARNYEQLVSLMPGVVFTGTGNQIYIGVSNPLSGTSNQVTFAINGGRTSQNSWTIDGADNVDRGANLTLLNYPSVDAIDEFRVLRGQYSAEFGRNAGGMVNVITKSGSNAYHGDLYEFFRNDKLAANNYFNNANKVNLGPDGTAVIPPLRYNNFGYTFGGPVWIPHVYKGKDKTFFFFSQEFRRSITYTSVQGSAPTADELNGIFPAPVCTSFTGTTCNTSSTTITNINPAAAAYIKDIFSKIPAGNASNIINLSLKNIFDARQELAKIDHVFSPKWQISGRFIHDSIPTEEPRGLFTGASLPGVSTTDTNSPGKGFTGRLTGSLSPTMINEAGYSYSYGAIISIPTGLDASVNSPDIAKAITLPYPVTLGRVPAISFSSTVSTLTGFGPYLDYNRNHNIFDNFTKIMGKHTIKTGLTIVHYNKEENQATNNVGTFTFPTTPRPTGSAATTLQQAWANFLLGSASNFSQTARDITPSILVNQSEYYVQDDYRVRKNLTLNIGVRYSIFRQATDGNGFLNNFDPSKYVAANAPKIDANGNLVAGTGDPLNGIIIAGKNSPYGNKVTNENNGNFAPRFGFSWDPFGKGKLAIRGGYGYAYDFTQVSNVYESPITTNPSSVQTISINNTSFTNPAGGGSTVVSLAPPALAGIGLGWKTPYVQQFSLDIQHELPWKYILDVGYYGSKGTHLIGTADINSVPVGLGVAAGLTDANTPFNRTTDPKLNQLRPYLGYNAINVIEPWFNSRYNSLQVAIRKQYTAGGFFGFNYTYSKLLTDAGTDVAAAMNFYNRRGDYGLSPYDRTQVVTANWDYQLPWLRHTKGVLGYTAGGWELSGIASFATGLPFNETDTTVGLDPGGLGILGSSAAGTRSDYACDPNANAPHTLLTWFNTACFVNVPTGVVRPGNLGRNTIRGPGYQNWDLSAFKNFHFTETRYLQVRLETFNTFNHTNWATINVTRLNAAFGQVTAARDPRIVQLGMKLYF